MLRQNSDGSDAVCEIRRHLFPGNSGKLGKACWRASLKTCAVLCTSVKSI